MKTFFMVVDEDKHREDEYEICVSLPEAIEAAQKRLDEAKGYYDDPEVEVRQKEADKKTEEVYCVSYALTTGIEIVLGQEHGDKGRFMQTDAGFHLLRKGEWARTESEAFDLAEGMRVKKLASLEKQRKS